MVLGIQIDSTDLPEDLGKRDVAPPEASGPVRVPHTDQIGSLS